MKQQKIDEPKFDSESELMCSFCGRLQSEAEYFISGPAVYICDVCISLCNEIIAERKKAKQRILEKEIQ